MAYFKSMFSLAVMIFFVVSLAQAQSVEGGGYVVYVPQSTEISKMPDGSAMATYHNAGVIISDDTSAPFHLATHDCTGTDIIGADGRPQATGSSCAARDADGDVWWLAFTNVDGTNKWHILGGTGKYTGMKGGGTTELAAASPDGRVTIRWTGTWTMQADG